MPCLAFLLRRLPMIGQMLFVTTGFLLLVTFPPVEGRMLLVPLTQAGRAALASVAVGHGARLVAAGPYAGSLRIEGRRDALLVPLLAHAIVPIAATRGGCGERGAA